jgi:hypothetical protein
VEGRFNLEAHEVALEHLNQTAGGVFGSDVVDLKSKNDHQEPKSQANPAERNQAAGIKFQDLRSRS